MIPLDTVAFCCVFGNGRLLHFSWECEDSSLFWRVFWFGVVVALNALGGIALLMYKFSSKENDYYKYNKIFNYGRCFFLFFLESPGFRALKVKSSSSYFLLEVDIPAYPRLFPIFEISCLTYHFHHIMVHRSPFELQFNELRGSTSYVIHFKTSIYACIFPSSYSVWRSLERQSDSILFHSIIVEFTIEKMATPLVTIKDLDHLVLTCKSGPKTIQVGKP